MAIKRAETNFIFGGLTWPPLANLAHPPQGLAFLERKCVPKIVRLFRYAENFEDYTGSCQIIEKTTILKCLRMAGCVWWGRPSQILRPSIVVKYHHHKIPLCASP